MSQVLLRTVFLFGISLIDGSNVTVLWLVWIFKITNCSVILLFLYWLPPPFDLMNHIYFRLITSRSLISSINKTSSFGCRPTKMSLCSSTMESSCMPFHSLSNRFIWDLINFCSTQVKNPSLLWLRWLHPPIRVIISILLRSWSKKRVKIMPKLLQFSDKYSETRLNCYCFRWFSYPKPVIISQNRILSCWS